MTCSSETSGEAAARSLGPAGQRRRRAAHRTRGAGGGRRSQTRHDALRPSGRGGGTSAPRGRRGYRVRGALGSIRARAARQGGDACAGRRVGRPGPRPGDDLHLVPPEPAAPGPALAAGRRAVRGGDERGLPGISARSPPPDQRRCTRGRAFARPRKDHRLRVAARRQRPARHLALHPTRSGERRRHVRGRPSRCLGLGAGLGTGSLRGPGRCPGVRGKPGRRYGRSRREVSYGSSRRRASLRGPRSRRRDRSRRARRGDRRRRRDRRRQHRSGPPGRRRRHPHRLALRPNRASLTVASLARATRAALQGRTLRGVPGQGLSRRRPSLPRRRHRR